MGHGARVLTLRLSFLDCSLGRGRGRPVTLRHEASGPMPDRGAESLAVPYGARPSWAIIPRRSKYSCLSVTSPPLNLNTTAYFS